MQITRPRSPALRTDPAQLRAIVELRRLGWTTREIRAALNLPRTTLYRRLGEIRDLESRPIESESESA